MNDAPGNTRSRRRFGRRIALILALSVGLVIAVVWLGATLQQWSALRAAFQMLAQGDGTFQDRARRLGEEGESDYVTRIVEFVTGASDRSFLTPGAG